MFNRSGLAALCAAASVCLGAFEQNAAQAQVSSAGSRPAIWTGFYAGVHAGGGKVFTDDSDIGNSIDGFIVGGHAGYNFQSGMMIYGIEGDYTLSQMDASFTDNSNPFAGPINIKAEVNYLASIRGRIGTAVTDTAMLYGTLGYAWSEVTVTGTAPLLGQTESISASVDGIVAGGGLEYKLSENTSARLEGLYYWLGTDGPSNDSPIGTIRAGLTLHLPPN